MSSLLAKLCESLAADELDALLQTVADLVYCERADSIPHVVPAMVVRLHPSQDITFRVTSPDWKARLGWGPSACLELQVHAIPEVRQADQFYWMERSAPSLL